MHLLANAQIYGQTHKFMANVQIKISISWAPNVMTTMYFYFWAEQIAQIYFPIKIKTGKVTS
jgi:hypothetical protein